MIRHSNPSIRFFPAPKRPHHFQLRAPVNLQAFRELEPGCLGPLGLSAVDRPRRAGPRRRIRGASGPPPSLKCPNADSSPVAVPAGAAREATQRAQVDYADGKLSFGVFCFQRHSPRRTPPATRLVPSDQLHGIPNLNRFAGSQPQQSICRQQCAELMRALSARQPDAAIVLPNHSKKRRAIASV